MTISRAWAIGIGAVLGLAIVIGGYELLQEHDARLKAETKSEALKPALEAAQKTLDQAQKTIEEAKKDRADTKSDLTKQLAVIAQQRTIIVTPQQTAAAMPSIIPNLPMPVQVQNVPATATAPATQNLVIPQADIQALHQYQLTCTETGKRLDACNQDVGSAGTIQLQTEVKLDATNDKLRAMTTDRDNWKTTAKGGTFWKRLRHDAVQIVVTGAVGYAAGRLSK